MQWLAISKRILCPSEKPRKPRPTEEIISVMRGSVVTTSSNEDHNSI